jgi:hypothetical protein
MSTTNSLGFGSLASVAWTPMDGTGLSGAQLTAVNSIITANTSISNRLLSAVNGAVNQSWSSFALSDMSDTTAAQQTEWADQISSRLGITVARGTSLSLGEWRRIAADLQNDAALQASKRAVGSGGGIKTMNGKWYVNGQEVSLLDVYMAVRVNQVSNFDDSLALYMDELKANNKLVKAANDWLARIRTLKPTDTSNSVAWSSVASAANSFSSTYGYLPSLFMPTGWASVNSASSYNYLKFDTWIEECKQYVSQKDTDNQIAQQKLEQMTNRRSEVLEGLTSFIKSQSQSGQSMSRNLG